MPSNSLPQPDFTRLQAFRQQAYACLHHRRDALFELLDAVVQTPAARSFADLALAPARPRQWHSQDKALAAATDDADGLSDLCLAQLPGRGVAHFALDVMPVRRMHSPPLLDRQFVHGAAREVGGRGGVIGLPYSLLAWVERRHCSGALTVQQQRLQPGQSAVAVALEHVTWLSAHAPPRLQPQVALDGAYSTRAFFAGVQGQPVRVVARLRQDRVLYRRPDPQASTGRGRPPTYGVAVRCQDAASWGAPDERLSFEDERYGTVTVEAWHDLSWRGAGRFVGLTLRRSQIHQERAAPPAARRYAADNGTAAAVGARSWWETIVQRWPIEPANRFRKDRLYAALPKVRTARQSDTGLRLGQLLEWEAFLARESGAPRCLPWQRRPAGAEVTPGRVLASLGAHLSQVGTPVAAVRRRGKSPGWPAGRERARPPRTRLVAKRPRKRRKVSKQE